MAEISPIDVLGCIVKLSYRPSHRPCKAIPNQQRAQFNQSQE